MNKNKLFCTSCDERVEVEYKLIDITHNIDDEEISVKGNIPFCKECGVQLSDLDTEDEHYDLALSEYRRRKNLLSVEEIKSIRNMYGLSQRAFARAIGFSESTINRYELGAIQDGVHNTIMLLAKDPKTMIALAIHNKNNLSENELVLIQEKVEKLLIEKDKINENKLMQHVINKIEELDKKIDFYGNEFKRRQQISLSTQAWPDLKPTMNKGRLEVKRDYLHQ